jgi:transposase
VKAFLKNHKLAGAIADCGMYEFKRQLEYKTQKFGSKLTLVDRFFTLQSNLLNLLPSSAQNAIESPIL